MKSIIPKFTLSIVLLMAALCSHASIKIDELYYDLWSYNKTAEVTYKSRDSNDQYSFTKIEIPSEISYNGIKYTVQSINRSAFEGCSALNSIIIPNSVTLIGDFAFNNCSGLASVSIPNSVTSIGNSAFAKCKSITSIEIPNSVSVISWFTFQDCTSLTSVKIPDSVTEIGYGAFAGCSSITSIEIPNSVTIIDTYAFSNCSSITSVRIPNSVTEIGNGAFCDCSSITSVRIPNSVTEIGDRAFDGCNNLKSINIPEGIKEISNHTFRSCSSLQSVTIPTTVVSIGNSAFESCGLQHINLHRNIKHIGENCFKNCANLNQIEIPYSLDSIPTRCFYNCHNLTNIKINNGVKWIGANAFFSTKPYYQYDIHIPPSVIHIGSQAFSNDQSAIIYNGNIQLGRYAGSKCKIFILDNNIPEFIDDGYSSSSRSIFYVPNRDSFINKTNYSSTNVYSIGEYGNGTNYETLIYDGTASPLKELGLSSKSSALYSLNLNWYSEAFDVADAGFYNGNSIMKIRHDDWESSFPISYAFKIERAPLSIKISDYEKIYGDENPEFSYSLIGLCESDNKETAFQQLPYITTTCDQKSAVGQYPIVMSAGSSKNYKISCVEGKLTVKKAPLTLAVNNATRTYGQPNPKFDISYDGFRLEDTEDTSFSELPSVITEATTKSDVGVYAVTANGGIAQNYEITEYKSGTLSVTKAPLILTANNAERPYYNENPNFDYTLTGLENDDNKSCITKVPEFACEAALASDCGEYDIVPSNAEAKNYDISYKTGVLKVTKAPLNISARDCSRRYGDANPRFEFIYSGLKEGDDATSVLSKLPIATCSARANSQVGYYDIEVSGAESTNYEITYTPGILTVEKAPLTIRPKDVLRIYGQTNPKFEISYMGFKNNEDESVLFRAPQVTTTATENSSTGQYSITASGASAQNYEIAYEQGILTISKNILKVIVNDTSRLYGDENPQFTVRYEGLLNGDTESVVTTKPQFTTVASAKSNAGVYNVTAYGASSPNYDIEYQSGNLTVNPRGISAKVGNYNRPYGTDNPEFIVDYTGLVNGDDKTAIAEPSAVTCGADKNSNVGTYAIVVTGGRGENYEVTSFTDGTLTVEKANQTIEWSQELSSVNQYNQIELTATSSSGLPVTYDVASNNVVDIYTSGGKTFLDCYGTGTVTIRATQQGNENYNPSETITNRLTVVSEGGYVDPSTPNISINVTTAGTLSSKIAESKKYQIKSLTITGNLNGSDIRYLREMAGRDVNGSKTNGILEKLDLSKATIVYGGDYYYTTNPSSPYNSCKKHTSDNQISDYMFYGCSTLTNLSLPQNGTAIGAHAFDGCLNLSNISMPEGILTIGEAAFNGDISLTRISIPTQTTSIGNYAFQGCSGLTTLILSSSVKTIGNGMLNGCLNIQEISLNSDNAYYSTLNGVLYNKAQTSLIIYPAGKQLQTFEIPDSVTEIKSSGFFGTKALEYLFLPESLTSIGADAFKGCSNLTKMFARPSTPAECANDCFEAVSKSNCALYVPRGSYNDYWAAPIWGEFLKIEESNDLSVGGNIAKPDYGFEFPETTLNKGKLTYIPVAMNNVDPVVAFNCDIVLPEGVAFYKDSNDQIVFKPSERFPLSQNLNSNLLPDGVLRVISTSSTNEAFSGTEGVLFYLPLLLTDTNANENSEYNLTVKDIEFTRKNQSGYSSVQSPDITIPLTVGEYTMGDANGDGRITSVDAVLAMSNFLGKDTPNLIFKAADMNFDGKISSIDVVLITDELLAQNQNPMALTKGVTVYKGNLLMTGTTSSSADFALNIIVPNAYEYTAIQMDITIPDGFTIKNLKVGSDNQVSHSLKYRQHPNGMTRIFISSDSNSDFTSDNILSIELNEVNTIHASQDIAIDDVLAVEITDDEILEWNICGDVANISEIASLSDVLTDSNIHVWVENLTIYIQSKEDGVISLYDISGRSRSIEINAGTTSISVVPGIYIINNKKIIVK